MTEKKELYLYAISFLVLMLFFCCTQREQNDFSDLKSAYLGQKPPGMTPEVFAPGIISAGSNELTGTFSPDGKEIYFVLSLGDGPSMKFFTFIVKQENNIWIEPQLSVISLHINDARQPFISPDGKKLFFKSNRAADGSENLPHGEIWVAYRTSEGWGKPENLGVPVNTDKGEGHPSVSADGTLYFYSDRNGGFGATDIYSSPFTDGHYAEPENLGENVNSKYLEGNPCIAPDSSYILYNSLIPEGFGGHDLYISFRKNDGSWTKAKNLGDKINTNYSEFHPKITSDGKYIFFSSNRIQSTSYKQIPRSYKEIRKMLNSYGNGSSDIYWVDAKIIEVLKPKEFN